MPLTLTIEGDEGWDEIKEEIIPPFLVTVKMEHSLVSLAKWEQHFKKPFLETELTEREMNYYYYCMTITKNIPLEYFNFLTFSQKKEIKKYIEDPMSATTVKRDGKKQPKNGFTTAETIYGMMIDLQIPWECQKWHLNTLLKLIEVQAVKQGPAKKMSPKEIAAQNHALHQARKAKRRKH